MCYFYGQIKTIEMFYALLIIIAVLALLAVSLYNRLVRLRNNRENAFADIDVQLKQRLGEHCSCRDHQSPCRCYGGKGN